MGPALRSATGNHFVGGDAHIAPHDIRWFSGKRRADVGIGPYKAFTEMPPQTRRAG